MKPVQAGCLAYQQLTKSKKVCLCIVNIITLILIIIAFILPGIERNFYNTGIEFSMKARIAKAIFLGCVLPIFVIKDIQYTICSFIIQKKTTIPFSLAMNLLLFVLLILFIIRMGIFYFFEYAEESEIGDEYIVQTRELFSSKDYKYYKKINDYLYIYISDWYNFDVLLDLQSQYGGNIRQINLHAFEQSLKVNDEDFSFTFTTIDGEPAEEEYYSSFVRSYIDYYWKEMDIDYIYNESDKLLILNSEDENINDMVDLFINTLISVDNMSINILTNYLSLIYIKNSNAIILQSIDI